MVVGPARICTSEELGVVHVAHLQHISPTSTRLQLHPAAVRLHASTVLLPRRILPYMLYRRGPTGALYPPAEPLGTGNLLMVSIQEPPGGFRNEGDGLSGNGRKGPMSLLGLMFVTPVIPSCHPMSSCQPHGYGPEACGRLPSPRAIQQSLLDEHIRHVSRRELTT
jgi:hypothetical protein